MQKPSTAQSVSTRFCWICGRAVSLEDGNTDEHGNIVHEECYAARMKLEHADRIMAENKNRSSTAEKIVMSPERIETVKRLCRWIIAEHDPESFDWLVQELNSALMAEEGDSDQSRVAWRIQ